MMNYPNEYESFNQPVNNEETAPVLNHTPVEPVTPPEPPKKKNRRGLKIVAGALACALVIGAAFGAGYAANRVIGGSSDNGGTNVYFSDREATEVTPVAVTGSRELSYTELYASTVNSVVSINASATENIWGQEAIVMASSGSGFIITEDGYIVTNYHVINGSNSVSVTLYDGTTYDATVVGGDEDFDIAVLKIDAEGLTPVVIGNSSELQVGNDVAVIGNPLGELTFSMSEGIISCTDRLINVDGTPFNMIQITAAVNSGNSGGPLFNMYGEVVGIVSAKLSSSSSSEASVEGLGFAIPIDDVVSMIEDIMTNGYVTNKPYLGISAGNFSSSMIPNSTISSGVYIYSVEEGGAAANAGLLAGDIITKLDDTEITSMDDLTAAKKSYSAGDDVIVEYYRNNQRYTTHLTFGTEPESAETTSQQQTPSNDNSQNGSSGSYNPWEYFNRFFGSSYSGTAA